MKGDNSLSELELFKKLQRELKELDKTTEKKKKELEEKKQFLIIRNIKEVNISGTWSCR